MGVLDEALGDVASILIGTFSDTFATYTRTPAPRYDPRTGEELRFNPTTYQVKLSPPAPYSKGLINGTTIKADDLRVYIAAPDLPVVPDAATDAITWLGTTYKLVPPVTPHGSADSSLLYELQLRK